MSTKYIVQAYMLLGSNVVFLDRDHLKNAEKHKFTKVDIYLSKQEIENLYKRATEDEEQ